MRLSDLQIPGAWGGLLLGLMHMTLSITSFPDKGYFWDFPILPWGQVILFFVGLCITLISMRAILRGEGRFKKPVVDEEKIAKAKAELERMYIQEYGRLPEYPAESREEEPGGQEGGDGRDGPEPKS